MSSTGFETKDATGDPKPQMFKQERPRPQKRFGRGLRVYAKVDAREKKAEMMRRQRSSEVWDARRRRRLEAPNLGTWLATGVW